MAGLSVASSWEGTTVRIRAIEASDDELQFVIEACGTGDVVGSLSTHDSVPRTGVFSYGIEVFPDFRRRGYAGEAITLLLAYYFEERRYQKCNVTTYDYNRASIALHRALGFQPEGRLRRTAYTAGEHHDELLYGITAEEFAAARSAKPEQTSTEGLEFRRKPQLSNEELATLLDESWDRQRPPPDYGRILARSLTWIGAYDEQQIIGYVNLAWDGGVHAFLLDTAVQPSYRHRGVGTRLVTEALRAAADHPGIEWVHVDSSPELLAGFYIPAGFRATAAGLVWVPDLREASQRGVSPVS